MFDPSSLLSANPRT